MRRRRGREPRRLRRRHGWCMRSGRAALRSRGRSGRAEALLLPVRLQALHLALHQLHLLPQHLQGGHTGDAFSGYHVAPCASMRSEAYL